MESAAKKRVCFFREFLAAPAKVGAVTPSSRHMAKAMAQGIELDKAGRVVEYGSGTGVFTREILAAIPQNCQFFAIERSPELATVFRKAYPNVRLYVDTVANTPELCEKENMPEVDCIVSGLPWSVFPEDLQDKLLEATVEVLRPGGRFATFAYLQGVVLPAGTRFRAKLHQYFSKVEKSPVVWKNFPPAFVYRCTK
jgi:phospholipid N-methyltransferase